MSPHGVYPCLTRGLGDDADWVAIACQEDKDWQSLLTLIGADFDRQWGLANRQLHAAEIDEMISKWTIHLDKDEVTEQLQDVGIAAGPVASAPDMLAEPHAEYRDFFVPLERQNTRVPGNPIHMKGLSSRQWTPCPALGAHSKSILQDWLGYTTEQTQNLVDTGIIAECPPD